ncbi:MAG: glutamate synthase subunit alpha, partial [Gaiellaceae bacterium]
TGEGPPRPEGGELGERLVHEALPALEESRLVDVTHAISNADRAVGARLGGEIARRFGTAAPPGRIRVHLDGVAGQSFGAFLASGVELSLVGEANDYVGKAMGGGRIVVRPPDGDAGDPVLLGNTVLYGATGGELFCAGRAGERFAVRNSGATAVVEGVGDHACEYMTGGTVVVLGQVGRNLGAGMSGGQAYVHDVEGLVDRRLNGQLVAAIEPDDAELDELRHLVERHLRLTGSTRAEALLADWERAGRAWRRVAPRPEAARSESAGEATLAARG